MAQINKPHNFTDGRAARASEVNANFDTLYKEFNGNIDADNLADNAVTTAKIADEAVTADALAGSITGTKLATDTRLLGANYKTSLSHTPDSGDRTSYTTVDSISIEPGSYAIIASLRSAGTGADKGGQYFKLNNATNEFTEAPIQRIYCNWHESGSAFTDNVFAFGLVSVTETSTIEVQVSQENSSVAGSVSDGSLIAIGIKGFTESNYG